MLTPAHARLTPGGSRCKRPLPFCFSTSPPSYYPKSSKHTPVPGRVPTTPAGASQHITMVGYIQYSVAPLSTLLVTRVYKSLLGHHWNAAAHAPPFVAAA